LQAATCHEAGVGWRESFSKWLKEAVFHNKSVIVVFDVVRFFNSFFYYYLSLRTQIILSTIRSNNISEDKRPQKFQFHSKAEL